MNSRFLLLASILVLPACDGGKKAPDLGPAAVLEQVRGLRMEHRGDEALGLIETYLSSSRKENPDEAEVELRLALAELLLQRERTAEAVAELESLGPVEGPARNRYLIGFADAHARLGEWGKALAKYGALPAPVRGSIHRRYSEALEEAGEKEMALAVRVAGLLRDPWDSDAYLALGRQLERAGKSEIAKILLERYQADEPRRVAGQEALSYERERRFEWAAHRLARAEDARENLYQALLYENQARAINKNFGEAILELARISFFLERLDETFMALQLLPPNVEALELLADVLELRGDLETAWRSLESATKITEDPELVEKLKARMARLKAGEKTLPSDASADITAARKRVRDSMKEKATSGLGAATPVLAELAEAYARGGATREGRRLALFLLAYPRGFEPAARVVPGILTRPGDLFYRLRAAWILSETGAGSTFDTEMQRLGVPTSLVLKQVEELFPDFVKLR